MTEEVENLVLEQLRAIRGQIDRMREEDRTMRAEIGAIRQTLGAHTTLLDQIIEDIATVRVRLDRIERRLELADAPK